MTASPAKIKAYLATIKEYFLDDSSSTSSLSPRDMFIGVLKMELLLRGIIVQDDKKLWNQIQSSVGKTMLSDLPKPLLAAANVVAGRVIELFYSQLMRSPQDDRSVIIPHDEAAGALQRAKDINDERWLILLRSDHKSDRDILQVALGFFISAAQAQSDTPPMWKKVWDTWALLRDVSNNSETSSVPPFEAQDAIRNLSRIALTKGNNKRASELKLRLVQSYLNSYRIELTVISPSDKREKSSRTILQCFGDNLTCDLEPSEGDNGLKMAERSLLALNDCQSHFEHQANDPSLITSETLLFQVLRVQALMMQEEAKVRNDAQEMYRMDQNRSVKQASLLDCTKQVRESFVMTSYKDATTFFGSNSLLGSAATLRDTMIMFWGMNSVDNQQSILADSTFEQSLCFSLVQKSAICLKDYAHILSQKSGSYYEPWNAVLEYILPVIDEMERQSTSLSIGDASVVHSSKTGVHEWLAREVDKWDGNGTSCIVEKTSLISTVASLLPEVYWMMLGDDDATTQQLDSRMDFIKEVLTGLIHWQQKKEKEERQASKKMSTVGMECQNDPAVAIRKWNEAKTAAICFTCQDDRQVTYQITRNAILRSKRNETKGSLGFLECLMSWAGWYQRPWPYCSSLSDTRRLLKCASSEHGRPLTNLEEMLLELASADAELLNGGFVDVAVQQYEQVMKKVDAIFNSENTYAVGVLQTHCYNGMARAIQMMQEKRQHCNTLEAKYAELSLAKLQSLDLPVSNTRLFVWHLQSIFLASKAYQLSVVRRLIADSLVEQGQLKKARSFLEATVIDSPNDAEAALAFGALLLRIALYVNTERNAEDDKATQIQLLKAAKLDSSKGNPFALLGVWFEDHADVQRALGCFGKSLAVDPCNPVAGRGMLRLKGRERLGDVLEAAIEANSPSNGWAWYAVGLNKASVGADDFAVVAILKGLRCRDIAQPASEKLGAFYRGPRTNTSTTEKAAALADVATCYRRLGRFTASIRAFYASITSTGDLVPSSVLLSCAQLELELGLFNEAADKFATVQARGEDSIASYGLAESLFSTARKYLLEGKAGAASATTQLAIENCLRSSINFGCQLKLLGDLYSLGASFPPNVFAQNDATNLDVEVCVRRQLQFISRAEDAYHRCLEIQIEATEGDKEAIGLKSSIMCDVAINVLLQAQLLSSLCGDSDDPNERPEVDQEIYELYERAAGAFRDALEENPAHAASWCGLGCAVQHKDPLLAQHAFCRCLELDKMYPDAYANVGYLYTERHAFDASRGTMDALTQVADTPMMWLNCAFILEREATRYLESSQEKVAWILCQAADAYRTSLQVMRHPAALLGLSLTSRVTQLDCTVRLSLESARRKDAFSLIKEYTSASFDLAQPASVLQGVMSMEKGDKVSLEASWKDEIFQEGKAVLNNLQEDSLVLKLGHIRELPESQQHQTENTMSSDLLSERIAQKKILYEPNRADLWLLLAKEFIRNGIIDMAFEASSRAAFMFSLQLRNLGKSSAIDATMISEVISLRAWLNELTKESKDTGESSIFDLQRALLMDPGNSMARRGLCH